MKKIIVMTSLLSLVACSSVNTNSRKLASTEKDLTGTYLCVSNYGKGHKGPNKTASRIYFHPSAPGKYDVVFLEYVDLLKMAPSYVASNKLPFIAKRTGYLKNITSKIMTYEATLGEKPGTYELRPLIVADENVVPNAAATPRILTLDATASAENPLEGATISSVSDNDPKEIFFPKDDDDKRNGFQYGLAKAAYKVAKLESTWRKEFLRGPYLSQYYNRPDIVLKLRQGGTAEFVINPAYAKMSDKKRAAMFTHPDSAFLKGQFASSEPRDGMFLFHPQDADEKTVKIVEGKIGLFIDVFDATVSLGQDVVELALIDPERPEEFLMYYEDPKNGEGTDTKDLK